MTRSSTITFLLANVRKTNKCQKH